MTLVSRSLSSNSSSVKFSPLLYWDMAPVEEENTGIPSVGDADRTATAPSAGAEGQDRAGIQDRARTKTQSVNIKNDFLWENYADCSSDNWEVIGAMQSAREKAGNGSSGLQSCEQTPISKRITGRNDRFYTTAIITSDSNTPLKDRVVINRRGDDYTIPAAPGGGGGGRRGRSTSVMSALLHHDEDRERYGAGNIMDGPVFHMSPHQRSVQHMPRTLDQLVVLPATPAGHDCKEGMLKDGVSGARTRFSKDELEGRNRAPPTRGAVESRRMRNLEGVFCSTGGLPQSPLLRPEQRQNTVAQGTQVESTCKSWVDSIWGPQEIHQPEPALSPSNRQDFATTARPPTTRRKWAKQDLAHEVNFHTSCRRKVVCKCGKRGSTRYGSRDSDCGHASHERKLTCDDEDSSDRKSSNKARGCQNRKCKRRITETETENDPSCSEYEANRRERYCANSSSRPKNWRLSKSPSCECRGTCGTGGRVNNASRSEERSRESIPKKHSRVRGSDCERRCDENCIPQRTSVRSSFSRGYSEDCGQSCAAIAAYLPILYSHACFQRLVRDLPRKVAEVDATSRSQPKPDQGSTSTDGSFDEKETDRSRDRNSDFKGRDVVDILSSLAIQKREDKMDAETETLPIAEQEDFTESKSSNCKYETCKSTIPLIEVPQMNKLFEQFAIPSSSKFTEPSPVFNMITQTLPKSSNSSTQTKTAHRNASTQLSLRMMHSHKSTQCSAFTTSASTQVPNKLKLSVGTQHSGQRSVVKMEDKHTQSDVAETKKEYPEIARNKNSKTENGSMSNNCRLNGNSFIGTKISPSNYQSKNFPVWEKEFPKQPFSREGFSSLSTTLPTDGVYLHTEVGIEPLQKLALRTPSVSSIRNNSETVVRVCEFQSSNKLGYEISATSSDYKSDCDGENNTSMATIVMTGRDLESNSSSSTMDTSSSHSLFLGRSIY